MSLFGECEEDLFLKDGVDNNFELLDSMPEIEEAYYPSDPMANMVNVDCTTPVVGEEDAQLACDIVDNSQKDESAYGIDDNGRNSPMRKRARRQAAILCEQKIRGIHRWENLTNDAPEIKVLEQIFDEELCGEVLSPSEIHEVGDMENTEGLEVDAFSHSDSESVNDESEYESSFIDDGSASDASSENSQKSWVAESESSQTFSDAHSDLESTDVDSVPSA
jgi:hypothetical protein